MREMASRIIPPPCRLFIHSLSTSSLILMNIMVLYTCCAHLSPLVLAHPPFTSLPPLAPLSSRAIFFPFFTVRSPLSHTSSFLCDSYGVDPTHCNFMLSGLETSLDLLARSSFVATIRLILSFYWLTCFYLLPPSPLFHDPHSHFILFDDTTSPIKVYVLTMSSSCDLFLRFTIRLHWNWALW